RISACHYERVFDTLVSWSSPNRSPTVLPLSGRPGPGWRKCPGVRGCPPRSQPGCVRWCWPGSGGWPCPGRWARSSPAGVSGRVVATLLEGVTVVGATVPRGFRPADARRLEARARERAAVLVAAGPWPGEAALRLRAEHSSWSGLGRGEGLLGERVLRVSVRGRGAAGRERVADLGTGSRAAA